ncbi:MAG: tyrosine-type recombinase/integrase [Aestuariivita sp.]|nr:tyrosine-type recombinase/integrase [Aestuariivita sp.]
MKYRYTKNLLLRGTTWYLMRRVPKDFRSVENRRVIWQSLKTDSLSYAKEKSIEIWHAFTQAWEAKLAGREAEAEQLLCSIPEIASRQNQTCFNKVATDNREAAKILRCIEALIMQNRRKNNDVNVEYKKINSLGVSVSEALDLYWDFCRDKTCNKSLGQIARWKRPRTKAIRNFINVVGDIQIDQITRDHMLAFRQWWIDRVEHEQLSTDSANKDMIHLGDVLKTVNSLKGYGLKLPLSGLLLSQGHVKHRPQFSEEWIRTKLLAPGALDGLNPEARAIFITMINTGARPSELATLEGQDIFLHHKYPHIVIQPKTGRELKSKSSERVIPLVGCSLTAMADYTDGFPRYRDSPSLSNAVNDYLSRKNLRETPGHSMYSLRHSFEERLRKAGIDERLRCELFGHSYGREKYGAPRLDELTKAVQTIAI